MSRRRILMIAAAILILAAGILLFIRWQDSSATTPAVILPDTDERADDTQISGSRLITAEITPETVQAAVSTMQRADAYSRSATVTLYSDGDSISREVSVWVMGSSARSIITTGNQVKNVLISGEDMWIWYDGDSRIFSSSVDEGFANMADRQQHMLTYEDMLTVDADAILHAEYGDYNGEPCIFVAYVSNDFNYVNRIHISVLTGLMMGSEIYSGDELIYSMVSGPVDLSAPAEENFVLPQ